MADAANVRNDVVQVTIGAANYFEAKVSFNLAGERIPIKPARFGEEVGALVGSRNIDITVELLESAAAVQRTILGFDGSGIDDAAAVGTAKPTVRIEILDPADSAGLGKITFYACELIGFERDHDGDGLSTPRATYRAMRGSDGKVWSIGPTT